MCSSDLGDAVEVIPMTLEQLRAHGDYGSDSEWARPQYQSVQVIMDRTDGEIGRVIDAKRRVPDEIRQERLRLALDSFINSYFRSARNRLLGLELAARLDAVESMPPFLETIFMFEGRVRPFNKQLAWVLARSPLRESAWHPEKLFALLTKVCDGDGEAQQSIFREVERAARDAGLADVIEGWQPDLPWLRGEGDYRAAVPGE